MAMSSVLALGLGFGLISAAPTLAAAGFSPTGSMINDRAWPGAQTMADGRVLVVGGCDGICRQFNNEQTAEIYDPALGAFAVTGSMAHQRKAPGMALLDDGRVLVAGGESGDVHGPVEKSAEVFNPGTGTFANVADMTGRRVAFTTTKLNDGRVLIVGGSDSVALQTAETFNPGTNTFTATTAPTEARDAPTASLLANGKVLVAGGYDRNGVPLASAEIFDPATNAFTATGAMSGRRGNAVSALLPDGRVLVAGGNDGAGACCRNAVSTTEIFDPNTGTFSAGPAMTAARAYPAAAVVSSGSGASGKLMVIGGDISPAGATADLYDPASGTFSSLALPSSRRDGAAAAALPNGRVLVAGGDDDAFVPLKTAILYQPDSPTPTPTSTSTPTPTPTPMPTPNDTPGKKSLGVAAKAVSRMSKLQVTIKPNLGKTIQWNFTIQKKSGGWKPLKKRGKVLVFKTTGATHTKTINLPKGSYRAVAKAARGYSGAASKVVRLKR